MSNNSGESSMLGKNTHKKTSFRVRSEVLICLFLVIATLAVYWQVMNHEFLNFDDGVYVTENHYVQAGLTFDGIKWSFGFTDKMYWHPLTWVSHMLDCQLYGLRADMHHRTNLILHIINCLLLFVVFRRMTGALWRSAFVASLFALHPLNVESIAWVAERKNVLSTSFWMLTMLTYANYSKRPGVYRYLLTFVVFASGLLAKPMLATLPFVLLLLDYWPLGRLRLGHLGDKSDKKYDRFMTCGHQGSYALYLVLEKIPFLALSVISIGVSSFSLQRIGILVPMESVPIKLRIANALVSYVSYIGKLVWPHNLTVFYPYPATVPIWQTAGAGLLLVCVTFLIIRASRSRPYLVVGWLWYLGTLVPVIGLVQAGLWPAMADRWTYVPLIGLFIIVAWVVPGLVARWRYREVGPGTMAAILLSILMTTAWLQVRYWSDDIKLHEHALDVNGNNPVAHHNLGVALAKRGKTTEAIVHYSEALRIFPGYVKAHNNLGIALEKQGRIAEAVQHYFEALRIDPGSVDAHSCLGNTFLHQGRIDEAIGHYSEALRIFPGYVKAHNNLGIALEKQGRIAEAVEHYSEALRIDPRFVQTHYNLGNALVKQGKTAEAIDHYLEILRVVPGFAHAHHNLGVAYFAQGSTREAVEHYSEALRIDPGFAQAHNNLGNALVAQNRLDEAINHYSEALRLDPGSAQAHNNLGLALVRKGKTREAIIHFRMALSINPGYDDARKNLKTALEIQGKIEDAVSKMREALKINTEDPELQQKLEALCTRKGELDEAINRYQETLSTQPGFAQFNIHNLPEVSAIKREYEKAFSLFEKIVELEPGSVWACYHIACIYARQNRIEESIGWVKKALKGGFNDWDLLKTDKDLENIRDLSSYKELVRDSM